MKTLVVIGTSNGCDDHGMDEPEGSLYNIHYNTESCDSWPYYLGKQLNFDYTYNLSISSLGIESYYSRIKHAIHIYNPTHMVIEIPSSNSGSIAINEDVYWRKSWLKDDWAYDLCQNVQPSRIRQTVLPWTVTDDMSKESTRKKLEHINSFIDELPIKEQTYQTYIKSSSLYNNTYLTEMVAIQCEMIDSYLREQNIKTYWYDFSAKVEEIYNDTCKMNMLAEKNLVDYMKEKYKLNKDNPEHYADRANLNSKHWRVIVDDIFVKKMKE